MKINLQQVDLAHHVRDYDVITLHISDTTSESTGPDRARILCGASSTLLGFCLLIFASGIEDILFSDVRTAIPNGNYCGYFSVTLQKYINKMNDLHVIWAFVPK